MTTKLNNQFFFVAPLEVVKVTRDNLEEAAAWCGGKVAEVASRKVEGRIDSYVWVPTPKGTQISWAFPGMFITRRIVVTLKNELTYTYQVYKRDYLERNYFGTPNEAVDKTWERAEKERIKAAKEKQVTARKKPAAPDIAKMMGQGNVTKEEHAETQARQAVEASEADDTLPTEILANQSLVQDNREKNRAFKSVFSDGTVHEHTPGTIRKVEDVPLPAPPVSADIAGVPDDAPSIGEAVALVEQELGGEVIEETLIKESDVPEVAAIVKNLESEVGRENLGGL